MNKELIQQCPTRRALAETLRQLIRIGAPYGLPRSAAELARRAGLPAISVAKWAANTGARSPTVGHVEALAVVYGLEPWEMLVSGWSDRRLVARVVMCRPAHPVVK